MNIHITLLGREILPLYYPIKQLKPDAVYIICTKQNREIAERLQSLLTQSQEGELADIIPLIKNVKTVTTHAYNFNSTIEACRLIQEKYPDLPASDFSYNITGGTKIMTLAAFAYAQSQGATAIYTDSKNLKYISLSSEESISLDIPLRLPEFIALHGQKISKADLFYPLSDEQEKAKLDNEIKAAREIGNFLSSHRDLFDELRQQINKITNGSNHATIPNDVTFSRHYRTYVYKCGSKDQDNLRKLTICNNEGETFLEIESADPKNLLFKGVWWELLVAEAISSISTDYVIWRNVEFSAVNDKESKNIKNEIDVLVNTGTSLLFVECKSGKYDSNNVHKVRTVRSTFGGEKSKAVIVSAWPEDTTDKRNIVHENAKDSDIAIISPSKKQGFASEKFLQSALPNKIKEIINKLQI